MRIFERLRERQNPRSIERDTDMEIAPIRARTIHDSAGDFQPSDGGRRGHLSGPPQASNSPA
jgi:hypothetical protein